MDRCTHCGGQGGEGTVGCPCREFSLQAAMAMTTQPLSLDDGRPLDPVPTLRSPDQPSIVVLRGPGLGSTWTLGRIEHSIGRDPRSDIFVDDLSVSRRHAIISSVDLGQLLLDCGSMNGTLVNGNRISLARLLHHGDRIQVGHSRLVYVDSDHRVRRRTQRSGR